MHSFGYQWLCERFQLTAFPLARPARVAAVSRVTETVDALLVPAQVEPRNDAPLEQLLFALKHEGVNLQVLAQALKRIPGNDIQRRVQATPSSRYARVLGFLWEAFNGRELEGKLGIAGPTVDLFDPKRYVTAPGQRNAR
jgi:hypothetical protein